MSRTRLCVRPSADVYGDSGQLLHGPFVRSAPQGSQVGFGGSQYGILQQTAGTVVGGAKYTLSADVVAPFNFPAFDYRMMLGFGGHDLATTTVFALGTPVTTGAGTFALGSIIGVAPVGATGPLLVFLENSNSFGFGTSTGFDNVALSSSAPEPTTWALIIAGFGLMGAALRRRRATAAA